MGAGSAMAASTLLVIQPTDPRLWWGDSALQIGFLFVAGIGAGLLSRHERKSQRRIQELGADLSQARQVLEHAEKMAALGTLGAGIAHEVNNPVSSILGRAERMLLEARDRGLADDVVRDLEVIQKHARRIGTILQRLLIFARPGGLEFQVISLNNIIEDVVPLIEPKLKERGLELKLNLPRHLPGIMGDQTRLEEVVLNILTNAIDASHPDCHIDIAAAVSGKMIKMTIADAGAGIDPDNLSRIFDPFYTTKSPGQGTGLGLYVAYQIINDHHGEISLSSEPGKGTTVTVLLPIVENNPFPGNRKQHRA